LDIVKFVIGHVPVDRIDMLKGVVRELYPDEKLQIRVRGRGPRNHGQYDQDLPINLSQWVSMYVTSESGRCLHGPYQRINYLGFHVDEPIFANPRRDEPRNGHITPVWLHPPGDESQPGAVHQ